MRDAYYGVVLAGSVAAVWVTGGGPGRTVSVVALCALVPWYWLVGRRAYRGRPVPVWTVCYQLGVLALLVTAQVATLTSSVVLFALIPQAFMLLPVGWALLALTLFNVVPVVEAVSAPSFRVVGVAGALALCVAFAAQFSWWIQRIIQQSRERADLIAQLAAARAELAESERQAGMLAERQRLAMEIHDTLAQGFTSILMLLEAADSAPPERARSHRERAARAARENLAEARALVAAQPPTELAGSSLPDALRRLVGRLGEETGVATAWDLAGEPRRLPAGTEVVVLRCAQEALTNVRRHARAASAALSLRYLAGGVRLDVTDDGAGFDPGAAAGFGLAGMRERVAQAGGHLAISSTPGSGTTVTVEVPA
ncbi:sensor histidine kinase [Actinocatenispora rupis]|uniref:Oxygen sensor histidine kinase NreB n=1 Tax=Actinocatenispora rupis TaxID=519421 RepID=A0A8J3JDE8_9ACTN|nr:sensor histidine kinase [Actinocatenispora rupis]GID13918.1 two-component sensor histidine kinase [Actinocatenispora rupis]